MRYGELAKRAADGRSDNDDRPPTVISIDGIDSIGVTLPGSYAQPSYGDRPSWRTKPRLFAWVRNDPEALVLWVGSTDERDQLVVTEPDKFFTTDHYADHPIVLVRLEGVDIDEATELVTSTWRLRAPGRLVKSFDDGVT